MTSKARNQGEGNREADKEYRERTRDFIESGDVDDAAKKAKKAVEGKDGKELKDAEKVGIRHARH